MKYVNKNEMIQKQTKLVSEKMKLDKFFSMFLDKCGSKMDPDKTDTAIWNLYKEKLNEYETVTREIKVLEYYIKGQHV